MGRGAFIGGVTVFASIVAGIGAAALIMLASEPSGQVASMLSHPLAVANFFTAALVSSLPVSLPAGIIGGVFVAAAAKKEGRPNSGYEWAVWGCVRGLALGSLISFGYFVLLVGWHQVVILMVGVGGVAGAATGAVVGMLVSRTLAGESAGYA